MNIIRRVSMTILILCLTFMNYHSDSYGQSKTPITSKSITPTKSPISCGCSSNTPCPCIQGDCGCDDCKEHYYWGQGINDKVGYGLYQGKTQVGYYNPTKDTYQSLTVDKQGKDIWSQPTTPPIKLPRQVVTYTQPYQTQTNYGYPIYHNPTFRSISSSGNC